MQVYLYNNKCICNLYVYKEETNNIRKIYINK